MDDFCGGVDKARQGKARLAVIAPFTLLAGLVGVAASIAEVLREGFEMVADLHA